MSESKQPVQMHSEDYDALIDLALAKKDKAWFEELVRQQKRLREMEIEMRRELGVLD
ncbi:IDEAL domain-containing protein [Brevibacillus parabrevis]|uniref:IDEAL domain-containing protein n=1 Tax=Brevibacillus parabrevis TaxID=54914 RepID=UPI001F61E233|nr:IDEAL domain-containing protein [Brevibacillus parabrevis]